MTVAKYYPGQIDAPYVAAMGLPPIPTGRFQIGHDLRMGESGVSQSLYPLGTDDYVVICFCPALSFYYGSGGVGRYSSGTKLSGITVQIENLPSASVLRKDGFDVMSRSRTMSELYGSDTTGFA